MSHKKSQPFFQRFPQFWPLLHLQILTKPTISKKLISETKLQKKIEACAKINLFSLILRKNGDKF